MIVGDGMLARAFEPYFGLDEGVIVFASGVANSQCRDEAQFDRERALLGATLKQADDRLLVYFGTCSVRDSEANETVYVRHKMAMEGLAAQARRSLILRLPHVVGPTRNPHTLVSYLHGRMRRAETVEIWDGARRNLIDAQHVAMLGRAVVSEGGPGGVVNIACTRDYSVAEIVACLERVTGLTANRKPVARGGSYRIDVGGLGSAIARLGLSFDETYLERTLARYYG
jgi:nucleoside-diphosphate-sugar epimerase